MTANDIIQRNAECARQLLEAGAEIERLTAARDAAMRVHMDDGGEIERLNGEVKCLHETIGLIDRQHAAEIERLRAALQEIATYPHSEYGGEIARRALEQKP